MGCWYAGHLFGLNFTHLNQGFLKDFSYSPEKMRNWDLKLWLFGIAVMVYFWYNVFFVAYCFISIGQGFFQLKAAFLVFLVLAIVTYALRKTHDFHLHHYSCSALGIFS